MIFRLSSFVFGLVGAFAACQSPKTTVPEPASATPTQVSYTVAERYFVKNGVEQVPLALTTQAEFEAVFGAAPVMGSGGIPTPIDFTQQWVIALAEPESAVATTIQPVSLVKNAEGALVWTYQVVRGEEQSYTSRASLALILPKSVQGPVVLVRQ